MCAPLTITPYTKQHVLLYDKAQRIRLIEIENFSPLKK